ncbi:protein croquemort-like isoform X2 [Neocloeon triangulifer]|uniref:protein croquemort-like isoform X2 n=1 Tax=Neocloeon triangulifer TaxID=2078957 RepID=UPI00286EF3B1|nr:protein croquemort-like isoform X2 [Neocloeon triangulifer]
MAPKMKNKQWLMRTSLGHYCLLGLGFVVAVLGVFSIQWTPDLFDYILRTELHLSESSQSYQVWKDTPVPMYIQFYFFNWTNPEQLEDKSTKPTFNQMGPYRFNEFHEKVNVTFHENNTVSFKQVRRWVFDPDHSNGTLEDQVTTLNLPPLTAAFVARDWSVFMQTPLSVVISQMETRHVTKKVREYLFEGYEDPLISLADTLPALAQIDIPFDRFGWFYKRNNSDEYDGFFNMDTGADDLNKVGRLRNWNYVNRTNYFPSTCGMVNGSAGELWPPGQTKTNISMFSPDLCRSLTFGYTEDVDVHGVSGYRYSGGRNIVDNGTVDADNWCFCNGDCLPIGVVNASSCRYGAPAFVSYPHYLMADPFYTSLINGMSPEKEKHQFYVVLEPTTGIPLDVAARFQINILLQPSQYISMYKRVPRVFFPIIWFEQRATMTPEMASSLLALLALPSNGAIVGMVMAVVGVAAVVVAISCLIRLKVAKASEKSIQLNTSESGYPLMKKTGNGQDRKVAKEETA